MFFQLITVATAATAIPLIGRDLPQPVLSRSKGFHLVANITNSAKLAQDRFAVLHHSYLYQYRYGPGADIPSLTKVDHGSTLWQNDTTVDSLPETHKFRYAVLADWMQTGDYLNIASDDTQDGKNQIVFTRDGGMEGFQINDGWQSPWSGVLQFPTPHESEVTLAACLMDVPTWDPQVFMIWWNPRDGGVDEVMPDNCAHIRLLAECAELGPLNEYAQYTREYAMEVPCFEDVKSVDWTQHPGPPW